MATDRARREAAEQRQQLLEQQLSQQQGMLEQQQQMMRWMTTQMFNTAPPGTFANPHFDLSWVSDQVPYCPMLAILNLVLLSNAHNFTCCRWAIRVSQVGPRVDRTARRRRLSTSTIRRSSGGSIRVLQVSSPTLDLVHHSMPVLGSLGNRL